MPLHALTIFFVYRPYLFKLKLSKNVKRHIGSLFGQSDWTDAGQGWEGWTMAALNGGLSKPVTSGKQLPYGPVDQYGGAPHQATNHDGRGTEHIVRLVVRRLSAGQVGMIFRVHGSRITRIGWFFLMIDCVHNNP